MSTRSAESRSPSPDAPGGAEKRSSKKRKVLSCYPCRNRKMKCDRIFPVCGRCARTGRADECTYDPRLVESLHEDGGASSAHGAPNVRDEQSAQFGIGLPSITGPTASESVTWKVRMQERRIELLEKKLASLNAGKDGSPYTPASTRIDDLDHTEEEAVFKETIMFRGKGFKTRFYGTTSTWSPIAQFSELQEFTRQTVFIDSSMSRIKADFKGFRTKRKDAKGKRAGISYSDSEILSLVPEKAICDQRVALYFQLFETTYRIMHVPSFWKSYEEFWKDRENTHASFYVVILLLNAIARNVSASDEASFVGDSSIGREQAAIWIDAADGWLERQSRKHLTMTLFQIQCLSLLAKRANNVKMKQDWVHAGEMIRLAMAAGLHRNPAFLCRSNGFFKEMRRRVWASMMEMELQTSLDVGLPSALCGIEYDCPAPANLHDEAFDVDTETEYIPAEKPVDQYTATSYLSYSRRSLALRIHLMQLLNSSTSNLTYADVLHYDTQITNHLSAIPSWENSISTPDANPSSPLLPHTLLDIQLRQYLLLLHRPFAKLARQNPRYAYSFTASISACSSMITQHDRLLSAGIHILNMTRLDTFRTAMVLAQAVYSNSITRSPDAAPERKGVESMNPSLTAPPTASATATRTEPLRPFPHGPLGFPERVLFDKPGRGEHESSEFNLRTHPNHHLTEKNTTSDCVQHNHSHKDIGHDGHGRTMYGIKNAFKAPSSDSSPPLVLPTVPQDDIILASICTSSLTLLEKALHHQETKMMRLGTGYMEYWLISACLGIMPIVSSPSSPAAFEDVKSRGHKAIDRMTRLCFKVLALQEDQSSEFTRNLVGRLSVPNSPHELPILTPGPSQHSGMGDGDMTGMVGGNGALGGVGAAGAGAGAGAGMGMGDMNLMADTMGAGIGTGGGMNEFVGFNGDVEMSGWNFPADFWDLGLGGDL